MGVKVCKSGDKVPQRVRRLLLIHPESRPIMVLSEDRKTCYKSVESREEIKEILKLDKPFAMVKFQDDSLGWVSSKYIREV